MDLSTEYLGLSLPHPWILGASPIVDDVDAVRRAEDAGVAAIVMHSLFEEQIARSPAFAERHRGEHPEVKGGYYVAERSEFTLDPAEYLEQLRRIKAAVDIPIIASLNGTTTGRWLDYAALIDNAGADALELNVYRIETDPDQTSEAVEQEMLDMVRSVRARTRLPLAVKLSPFVTSLGSFSKRLVDAGADGLVLFNRFYQPDLDLDELEVTTRIELSGASELLLRLRWLAILSAQLDASLAVTGGVHSARDALKAVAAGAHGVQVVSVLLKHGLYRMRDLRQAMADWLELKGYDSLGQLRGCMNLSRCPNPSAYERVNYVHVLNSDHWPRPE